MANLRTFWRELQRRNVLRAGLLYAASTWLVVQVATQVFPFFGIDDWVVRWVVVACLAGAPFWLLLAWFYEWTPAGLKRESEVPIGASIARSTGRRLDYAIIAVLALVIVLLVANTLVWRHGPGLRPAGNEHAGSAIPEKSVAVLPFANLGGGAEQQYFSDGLSEELISDLAQLGGLKVIGRYSSFQFRDAKVPPAQIGAALGVANLIEGSVREHSGHLRVIVNLIRASDGASIWAHTYDREPDDILAIQANISRAVAEALQVKLLDHDAPTGDRPASGNAEAYRLVLQGRAIARRLGESDIRHGIELFQQAVRIDPGYAFAWGLLSNYQINLGAYYLSGDAQAQAYADARAALAREIALAPDSASSYIDRGYVLAQLDFDQLGALDAYRHAVAAAPGDGVGMSFLAMQLAIVGQLRESADVYRSAIATDPLRPNWYAGLASTLAALGQLDEAERAVRKAMVLQRDFPGLHLQMLQIDVLRGDAKAAARDAAAENEPGLRTLALAVAAQLSGDHAAAEASFNAYLATHGKANPYNCAVLYAIRDQPAQMFRELERAWRVRDSNLLLLLYDPIIGRYRNDPRFAAFRERIGLAGSNRPPRAAGA